MNSIKEFFLSFLEATKDRLKNPMIGAFVIAWIVMNWRILAILLFSEKTIEQKIEFVEANYLSWDLSLKIPLMIAVFYVLILPYLMAAFDWLSQRGIALRKEISKQHKLTDIQNRQEIAAEEWQLEKIREGSPDIQAMKDQISKLELQLEEKDEVIANLSEGVDSTERVVEQSDTSKTEDEKKTSVRRKSPSRKSTSGQKTKKEKTKTYPSDLKDYPIMKDIVIRDLAKTEREWILIYALYTTDFGKKSFTREDIVNKYEESNRKTSGRIGNLTNNLNNMIKSGQLKFINDDDMLLTNKGKDIAIEILNR